jgi:hypothetical protein
MPLDTPQPLTPTRRWLQFPLWTIFVVTAIAAAITADATGTCGHVVTEAAILAALSLGIFGAFSATMSLLSLLDQLLAERRRKDVRDSI